MKKLLPGALVFVIGLAVGCAQPVDDEAAATSSSAALEERWSLATPTIFEIEGPLDLTFNRPEDWSDLEVIDPLDPHSTWKRASTVAAPTVRERSGVGSTIKDQLGNGFGSGACRPRLNPFKKEIGFKCKWTF